MGVRCFHVNAMRRLVTVVKGGERVPNDEGQVRRVSFGVLCPYRGEMSNGKGYPRHGFAFVNVSFRCDLKSQLVWQGKARQFPDRVVGVSNVTIDRERRVSAVVFFIGLHFMCNAVLSQPLPSDACVNGGLSFFDGWPTKVRFVGEAMSGSMVFKGARVIFSSRHFVAIVRLSSLGIFRGRARQWIGHVFRRTRIACRGQILANPLVKDGRQPLLQGVFLFNLKGSQAKEGWGCSPRG